MHIRLPALAVLAITVSITPTVSRAAQGYDSCTGFIDSIPATISTPGTWCLRKDLNTRYSDGVGISIQTNNVTIDCNDFKLGNLAAGAWTQFKGIYAWSRQNVTVRNCTLRGFQTGIYVWGDGIVIENNRLTGNTRAAIDIQGDGSVIRNNRILDTGGALPASIQYTVGIWSRGSVDILDNLISGVSPVAGSNGGVAGIAHWSLEGGQIRGNRIRGLVPDGTGTAEGISTGDYPVSIEGNQLLGSGGSQDRAIGCHAGNVSSFRNNTIARFGITSQGCIDAGGNVVLP